MESHKTLRQELYPLASQAYERVVMSAFHSILVVEIPWMSFEVK